MSRFKVDNYFIGAKPTVMLTDTLTGANCEIALYGATLLNFIVPLRDKFQNIIDGYRKEDELIENNGARSRIMAPFSNKIENDRYSFNGNNYFLLHRIPGKFPYHGFIGDEEFEIKNIKEDFKSVELKLKSDALFQYEKLGYPFKISLEITFQFSGSELNIILTAKNKGKTIAPFGCGWHPYFKTNENVIDNLILELDSEKTVLIDENFIPLENEKAYANIEDFPTLNFSSVKSKSGRRIQNKNINLCFVRGNKPSFTKIIDEENGIGIKIFQERGVTYLFDGTGLKQRARHSIAVEPVEFITNSFNRNEYKDELIILPGKKKIFQFGFGVFYL